MSDEQAYLDFIQAVEHRAHALVRQAGISHADRDKELAIDLVQFCMDTRYQFTTREALTIASNRLCARR